MAGKRCSTRGCPRILTNGRTRCPEHQAATDQARGTTTQRGYGHAHQAERDRWETILATRSWPCARCGELIPQGAAFDLGHTDDRSTWSGPEHVRCNRSAGGASASRNLSAD